jgi:hypothetical protein
MKRLLTLAMLLPLGACATVTRGTHESFTIVSEPPGALAKLSNGLQCETPCSLNLKRKDGFTIDLSHDGFEPVHATVSSGVSGGGAVGMAGNVILGGLIGAVIDGTNGSMNDLSPNPLTIHMVPLGTASAGAQAVKADK